jgi:hypothetical protein
MELDCVPFEYFPELSLVEKLVLLIFALYNSKQMQIAKGISFAFSNDIMCYCLLNIIMFFYSVSDKFKNQ